MAAAQRLMLKHNLDVVRSSTTREYGFAHLGRPTGRVGEHERLVAMILGKHFFVEAIWVPVYRPREGKRGSLLEICGTLSNLAIAEYAHGFLHGTAERLWIEHKRDARTERSRATHLPRRGDGGLRRQARAPGGHAAARTVWCGSRTAISAAIFAAGTRTSVTCGTPGSGATTRGSMVARPGARSSCTGRSRPAACPAGACSRQRRTAQRAPTRDGR